MLLLLQEIGSRSPCGVHDGADAGPHTQRRQSAASIPGGLETPFALSAASEASGVETPAQRDGRWTAGCSLRTG